MRCFSRWGPVERWFIIRFWINWVSLILLKCFHNCWLYYYLMLVSRLSPCECKCWLMFDWFSWYFILLMGIWHEGVFIKYLWVFILYLLVFINYLWVFINYLFVAIIFLFVVIIYLGVLIYYLIVVMVLFIE